MINIPLLEIFWMKGTQRYTSLPVLSLALQHATFVQKIFLRNDHAANYFWFGAAANIDALALALYFSKLVLNKPASIFACLS